MHFSNKIQALKLEGPDSVPFLENLTTQSVKAQHPENILGFHNILDAKGKILFDFQVLPWSSDSLVLISDLELTPLLEHLDKMLFAEDVELNLEELNFTIFEGDQFWKSLNEFEAWKCQKFGDQLVVFSQLTHQPGICVYSKTPLNSESFSKDTELQDFIVNSGLKPEDILSATKESELKDSASSDELLQNFYKLRFEAGIPHSDHLIGELFNHVGLFDLYLNEDKGCYPGQEIVTRINQRGQSTKHIGINQSGEIGLYKLGEEGIKFPPFEIKGLIESSAEDLYHEGLGYFHQGEYGKSIDSLQKSLTLNPKSADSWEALGVCFERTEKLDLAIQTHKKFARVSPKSVMAHANLSRLYMLKGWIDQAEKEQEIARNLHFEASAEEQSKDAEALAEAQNQLDQEKQKRVNMFMQVLEIDPDDDIALFGLGKFYQDKKEPQKALEYLEKLIAIKPDYAAAYPIMVKSYIALDKFNDATKWIPIGQKVCEDQGAMVPLKQLELQKRKIPEL